MDHSQAIHIGAAEKYLLNELNEEERSQYEGHFFDCGECADDVRSSAVFEANAKEVLKQMPERRVAGTQDPRVARPDWRALFWPVPLGAAAALVIFVGLSAYHSLFELPDLRSRLKQAEGLQTATWHFLSLSRSDTPVVTVSTGQLMVGLTLSQSSDRAFPYYRCEVQETQGRPVLSEVVPAPAQGEELQILVPAARLRPGAYALVVTGLESASGPASPESARYHFTLRYGARGERDK